MHDQCTVCLSTTLILGQGGGSLDDYHSHLGGLEIYSLSSQDSGPKGIVDVFMSYYPDTCFASVVQFYVQKRKWHTLIILRLIPNPIKHILDPTFQIQPGFKTTCLIPKLISLYGTLLNLDTGKESSDLT